MKTLRVGLVLFLVMTLGPPLLVFADTWKEPVKDSKRFTVLSSFNNQAVLDNETGLVWEQSPSTSPEGFTWLDAQSHCLRLTVGNRRGWRLPTVQELSSLVDPSSGTFCPNLPSGHPFNTALCVGWTATTSAQFDISAWKVFFEPGLDASFDLKINALPVWCVRGGQGVDPQ